MGRRKKDWDSSKTIYKCPRRSEGRKKKKKKQNWYNRNREIIIPQEKKGDQGRGKGLRTTHLHLGDIRPAWPIDWHRKGGGGGYHHHQKMPALTPQLSYLLHLIPGPSSGWSDVTTTIRPTSSANARHQLGAWEKEGAEWKQNDE